MIKKVFRFLFITVTLIPIIGGIFRFISKVQPEQSSSDMRPVSEMYLNKSLSSKVYAGEHGNGDVFFLEQNGDPIAVTEINQETSGCTVFPTAYAKNTNCGDKGASNINAIVATFENSGDCFSWALDIFWGTPNTTSIDQESYTDFVKSYYDCTDTSNAPPYCWIGQSSLPYFYVSGGKDTAHTSLAPVKGDGDIYTQGGQYLCFYAEPCTDPQDESYWEIELLNNCPTADAGQDQSVNEGETVNLDGSGSVDADDPACQTPTYTWQQVDTTGYNVSLTGGGTTTPSFTAPDISEASVTLTFRITIDDEQCEDTDDVDVVITRGGEETTTTTSTTTTTTDMSSLPETGELPEAGIFYNSNEKILFGLNLIALGGMFSYIYYLIEKKERSIG